MADFMPGPKSNHEETSLENFKLKPAWYKGLNLNERKINFASLETPDPISISTQNRLLQWQGQKAFGQPASFEARLRADSLTRTDLLKLLEEAPEALQTRTNLPLDWAGQVMTALESKPVNSLEKAWPDLSFDEGDTFKPALFLKLLKPLLYPALVSLENAVTSLLTNNPGLPLDPGTVGALFLKTLPGRVIPKLSRAIALEINIARLLQRLEGNTSEERFENFLAYLGEPANLAAFLEEYPVLARALVTEINHWKTFSLEILNHLGEDWAEFQKTFQPAQPPGNLIEINAGEGDSHRGGRTVVRLRFSSGFTLMYKPRSLAGDYLFQTLLEWVNEHSTLGYRTLKILTRPDYGWSEFVEKEACFSVEEVERFYRRQGGYLALLYGLDATDFHVENLIAAGEHPVLIDLETLFHPHSPNNEGANSVDPAQAAIYNSVLRVGLLPEKNIVASNSANDLSGLGNSGGQISARRLPTVQNFGTDRMRVAQEHLELGESQNTPYLDGYPVRAGAYLPLLLDGFREIYRLLADRRQELLKNLLPSFQNIEMRYVPRPTQTYDLLLRQSFHPDWLRDGLERERVFDNLWIGTEQLPELTRLVPFERADLWQNDVPLFNTRPGSADLFSSTGEAIPGFFREPAYETVQKRLAGFGEAGLAQQTWLIEAAFAGLEISTENSNWQRSVLLPDGSPVTVERLVAAAEAVGERLAQLANTSGDYANWLTLDTFDDNGWKVTPAGLDLYDGLPGIVLFLAYLGEVTRQEKYKQLARNGLKTLDYRLKKEKVTAVGAFNGLGSAPYLYSHLGVIWNEPTLLDQAEELAYQIEPLIKEDGVFDIIEGASGTILSLICLYKVRPSPRMLEIARQAGGHLISNAQMMEQGFGWARMGSPVPPLAGFSHGSAGIGYSLLELGKVSEDKKYLETALAAFAYETTLYSEQHHNWQILSDPAANATASFGNSWCHGAPGIALSRLYALNLLTSNQGSDELEVYQELNGELKVAVETTLRDGFGLNHSLCHGDLGNLNILLQVTRQTGQLEYRQKLEEYQARILDSLYRQGWISGLPLGKEAPGLMTGIAGIGYGLLGQAFPDQVPSVLNLAGPILKISNLSN